MVTIPPHSRFLSVFVVRFIETAANSKAMLAMLRLRYFSLFSKSFFAFLDSGLFSNFPSSFLCADNSCFSLRISMLFSFCSCFFLVLVVVCGVVLAMILIAFSIACSRSL